MQGMDLSLSSGPLLILQSWAVVHFCELQLINRQNQNVFIQPLLYWIFKRVS